MTLKTNLSIILGSSLILLSSHAFAEEEQKSKWDANLELGYVATSGNNDTTSSNGRFNLGYEEKTWRHQGFIAVQSNSNDASPETDTENYSAQAQSDYKISERAYFFALLDYDQIDNSGFDNQTSINLGYGYNFVKTEEHILDAEIGYGYRESNLETGLFSNTGGTTIYEGVGRIGLTYEWNINENAKFEQLLSSEIGDENTISSSSSSLSANVSDSLALKVSYELRHQSDVPSEEFESVDRVTSFTAVYTF